MKSFLSYLWGAVSEVTKTSMCGYSNDKGISVLSSPHPRVRALVLSTSADAHDYTYLEFSPSYSNLLQPYFTLVCPLGQNSTDSLVLCILNGIKFLLPLITIKHRRFLLSHNLGMRVSRYEGRDVIWPEQVRIHAGWGKLCPVSELLGRTLNDISLLFCNSHVPLLQCF